MKNINEITQARNLIKKGYGGNVELIRVYKEKESEAPKIALVDILDFLYNELREEKRRGINANKYIKFIKKGTRDKKDLLTCYSGKQATNLINDIALMEIIASKRGFKILDSEEIKNYNDYLKTKKEMKK